MFQRAPPTAAPVPSKRANFARAIRNAFSGPLYREAILEAVYQGLDLAGTQFRQSALDRNSVAQLRVWCRQPFSCVILIVPYCFSGCDDAREPLSAFTFDHAQFAAPPLVRSLRHDSIEATICFAGRSKNPAHRDAERRFRQSFAYNFLQVLNGGNS